MPHRFRSATPDMPDSDQPRPSEPLFLERQSYRRRRLMDGARVLPAVGAVLFMFPVFWAGPGGEGTARTAMGGVYVFLVWSVLITAAAVISHRLVRNQDAPADPVQGEDAG